MQQRQVAPRLGVEGVHGIQAYNIHTKVTEQSTMPAQSHQVQIHWSRGEAAFTDNRYSRGHTWRFDGGIEVPESSSPHVVRVSLSVEAAVDPEEAFVAANTSCHKQKKQTIAVE